MKVKIITLILVTALLNLSGINLVTSHANSTSDIAVAALPNLLQNTLPSTSPNVEKAQVSEAYGKLPLSFERNQGQTNREVKFLSRGKGYTMFLTAREAVLALRQEIRTTRQSTETAETTYSSALINPKSKIQNPKSSVLRMRLEGKANPAPRISGLDELSGKSNYLTLDDSVKPVTDVPHYSRVKYEGVYRGIDMIYYGNQSALEYDFMIAPGADPSAIKLSYAGADHLSIEADGSLAISLKDEVVRVGAPVIYQEVNGERISVDGKFHLDDKAQVSFEVGAYDANRELVIDPTLLYATYLGGNDEDQAEGIAVDAAGNTYIAGSTGSTNFPTTAGSVQVSDIDPAGADAFVTKLNAQGTALVYSTYIGGAGTQLAHGLAVDSTNRVIVVGETTSTDTDGDAFAIRINAAGSSIQPANGGYTRIWGGAFTEVAYDVALDTAGQPCISGTTGSANGGFQPTANGVQQIFAGGFEDAFVTKLDSTGAIAYSTYLGLPGDYDESGTAIAVDAANNIYVAGGIVSYCSPPCNYSGVFAVKLNAAGSSIMYSPTFGGSGVESINDIAVDGAGNAYVTGVTNSTDFQVAGPPLQGTLGGGNDVFFTRLDSSGNITYSTFLGTAANQSGNGIALDSAGNVYLTGGNSQFDALGDAFAVKLGKNGSTYLLSSGYSYTFGGSSNDYANKIAVDAAGNAYVAGVTSSTDFQATANAFQGTKAALTDAFVAKVGTAVAPPSNNPVADFDGDGKSDVSVWRATNGGWYISQSSNNQVRSQAFGLSDDKTTPGDYDGDGKADIAVYRPSNGSWYIIKSSTNAFTASQFGISTDIPAAGDYDGDNKTDIAVFRPSNGTFYILQSTNNGVRAQQFGQNGDKPVVGDYDNDGKADIAVFRPSNGTWYQSRSTAGFIGQQFGVSTDLPAQGDYDGDGKTDLAVFRPSNGTWYLQRSTAGFTAQQFGTNGDRPAPGDFDGDGKTDIAVFRPSNGGWYIMQSTAGFRGLQFGTNGDVPVEAGYIP